MLIKTYFKKAVWIVLGHFQQTDTRFYK